MLRTAFLAAACVALVPGFAAAADQAGASAELSTEEKIIAHRWGAGNPPRLYVAVQGDGSSRNGYAEYLCFILADHGLTAPETGFATVQVIEAAGRVPRSGVTALAWG